MSKEKISSQEIVDLVSSKAAVSKRAAEEFLKVMISTIEEALIAGEIVKIKNFGTFKLQWNEPRKSVNVQTGEDIILSGYHKVSFSPDTQLRDLVNEPFAHLEPINLDNELIENNQTETEPVLDPLRILNEQAFEIKNLLDEIQGLTVNSENIKNDEIKISKIEDNQDVTITDDLNLPQEVTPQIEVEVKVDELPHQIHEEIFNANIESIHSSEESVTSSEPTLVEKVDAHEEIEPLKIEEEVVSEPKEIKPKKRRAWLFTFLILILISGLFSSIYNFYPPAKNLIDQEYNKIKYTILKKSENISVTDMLNALSGWISPKPKTVEVTETVVVPKDTAILDSVEQKPQIDSLQMLFDNPRIYNEFIGSERIRNGSRLTIISKRYYGNKNFWVYIYEANRERIPNPDNIPVGTLVKIPKLDKRLIDASNVRCIQKAKELHDLYIK